MHLFDKSTIISFIAGSVNGLGQVILSHPLDTIKINYQTNNKHNLNLKYLYKGIKYPILTIIPIVTLQFTIDPLFNSFFKNNFISGATTGFLISPLVSLTDLLRIKKQKEIQNKLDIYRGLKITAIRETLSISLYFGCYSYVKQFLETKNINKNLNYMLSGSICGSVSWTLTYPIDVMKSRIQSYKCDTIYQAFSKGNFWKGI